MTTRYQRLILNVALQNRFVHSTGPWVLKPTNVKKSLLLKDSFGKFDKKEFLESLLNSSIAPYLNPEKFVALQPYISTRTDVCCTYNCVIDEAVAKDIVEKILSDRSNRDGPVMEGNPGLGLITINLINAKVPQVYVFDNSAVPQFSLLQIKEKFPNKIIIMEHGMNTYPENVILEVFDFGIKNESHWTFIGIVTSFYFLRSLVITTLKFELWDYNTNVYLVVSAAVLNTLMTGGGKLKYLIYSGFHLLFSIEEIASYPRKAFLPRSVSDYEEMYLIRIKNNPDLFEIIKKKELKEYFHFISILGTNRKNLIIPTLEKWLPDCGPLLISKGISMTNELKDLNSQECVALFKFFKKSRGYENFKSIASQLLTTH